PPGDYAGRLIEQAGLKGKVLGGAKISEKHANWIVTTHGAKASDVYGLLKLVQNTVEDKFGIKLEPEIKLIGFE
ncbi:MAG: UDP-N-acetylenolpyruvoylglucosamine reductase, partial [Deltaproteobacteria bacterium]